MNIIRIKLTTTWGNQVRTSHKIQIRYFETRTLNSVLKKFGNGPKGRLVRPRRKLEDNNGP